MSHLVRARRRHSKGLSLIEIVVVVTILAIVAAVGGTRYLDSLALHRARGTARRIAADLETARHAARSRSVPVSISFDAVGNRYTIVGIANPDHPSGVNSVELADGPLQSDLTAAAFGGDATIIFNAFGMPDSGGTLTVQSGGTAQTVTVIAGTGAVTTP